MQLEFDVGHPLLDNRSPLVYPGGKKKSIKTFKLYLPTDVKELVSPFIGGGAIELYCAARGIQVTASDNFEPLVNFWKYFLKDPNELMDYVLSLFPLNEEQRKYYHGTGLKPNIKSYNGIPCDDFERAAIFHLLNRQSFRGWTLAYGHGKNYDKSSANPGVFDGLRKWYNPNIRVSHSDYEPIICDHEGTFMYFDPPYVDKEECYGWNKEKTPVFDHVKFRNNIANLNNRWILSYKKHDLIMDLYKDFRIVEYTHKYTIHYGKNLDIGSEVDQVTELFVFNF